MQNEFLTELAKLMDKHDVVIGVDYDEDSSPHFTIEQGGPENVILKVAGNWIDFNDIEAESNQKVFIGHPWKDKGRLRIDVTSALSGARSVLDEDMKDGHVVTSKILQQFIDGIEEGFVELLHRIV